MKYSTLKEEKKLWGKGFRVVVGIDEVGRGPLAGPVIACAVTVQQFLISNFKFLKLKDSKKLTPKQREELFPILTTHPAIEWGTGRIYPKMIDRINIFQATKLAMQKALQNLECKLQSYLFDGRQKDPIVDFLIVDGTMELEKIQTPQKAIVKGDEKVFSCAAASVIAKVTRDRIMLRYHKKYPQYGFNKHKGYGTPLHLKRLWQYGPCPIHRRSFAPCIL